MGVISSLIVNVSASTAGFGKAMKDARKDLGDFGKALSSPFSTTNAVFAGLAGAGFTAYAKSVADAIDETAKLSDQLGVSMEGMTGLQHGASLAGVSNEGLATSLGHMVRLLGEAHAGGTEARDAFEGLGLSVESLGGMGTEGALGAVADQINTLPTAAERANAAFKVFGKSGLPMLSLIQDGAAGLKAATDEARKFGEALSRTDAASIEAANDSLTRMGQALKGVATQAVIGLAPHVTELASQLTDAATAGENLGSKIADGMEPAVHTIHVLADLLKKVSSVLNVFRGGAAAGALSLVKMKEGLTGNIGQESVLGLSSAELQDSVDRNRKAIEDAWAKSPLTAADEATRSWMDSVNKRQAQVAADAKKKAQERLSLTAAETPGKAPKDAFEQARRAMEAAENPLEKYARKVREARDLFGKGAFGKGDQALKGFNDVVGHEREDLLKGLKIDKTPLEEYTRDLQVLRDALRGDTISTGEYERAAKKLGDTLERSAGLEKTPLAAFQDRLQQLQDAGLGGDQLALGALGAANALRQAVGTDREARHPQAMELGSAAAVGTIIKSMGGGEGRQTMEELLRQANEADKVQIQLARDVVRELQELKKLRPEVAQP